MSPAESIAPARRGDVHARQIDGELVILDSRNERMHSLNAVAAFIFEQIDGRRTEAEIWCEVVASFEVSPDVAERDTLQCLAQLRELGLVT